MKTFGIGLALLAAGFALFVNQAAFAAFLAGMDLGDSANIWKDVFQYTSIAIMVFGPVWYWILAPLLKFAFSGKKTEEE